MTIPTVNPTIRIDPARIIDEVDPRIYSGFTEHMGRCIYGGIYDPQNQNGLSDEKTGFRMDVMDALKALKIPAVRYPGGNFVSTYRWQDGVGPRELRPRRPDLAWLTEESNEFGTDEFIDWCRELGAEPFICLNMGTGTLEDALAWLEYCNGTGNTHYANLRRTNGHVQPHGVKYWALGNEMWGSWQVGQMESQDYAKIAFQWAKALRLLDPTIKLISCGESGFGDWDSVTIRKLAPVVDFHSIHLYTSSEGKHAVNVMGPAEKGLEITRSLIELAKIEAGLDKELNVCFDEWNVWDYVRGMSLIQHGRPQPGLIHLLQAPGEKGAEEHYDLSDALAVAAWLNVFVRKADIVKIACIAQSVNVISPIMTSPSGLFKQTTYYPLHLFSNLMRGTSLSVHVDNNSPSLYYSGPTKPKFIQTINAHTPDSAKYTKFVDVSAVLVSLAGSGPSLGGSESEPSKEIRIAIVNRSEDQEFTVPILFGPQAAVGEEFVVHEIWHEDLGARNGFDGERVKTVVKNERFTGKYTLKKHSFQILVFQLISPSS